MNVSLYVVAAWIRVLIRHEVSRNWNSYPKPPQLDYGVVTALCGASTWAQHLLHAWKFSLPSTGFDRESVCESCRWRPSVSLIREPLRCYIATSPPHTGESLRYAACLRGTP